MVAHNICRYDNRLTLPKLAEKCKEFDFLCVGENIEKYFFLA